MSEVVVSFGSKEGFIKNGAVTAVKISSDALVFTAFSGKNGSGACTLNGAKVGDVVAGVVSTTDGGSVAKSFETVITVADHIRQHSSSDYSKNKFSVLLLKQGA